MTDTTIGPQRPNDSRGWLVFDYLPDDLQRAEDATMGADWERMAFWDYGFGTFTRPATATERLLLEHLGYQLPDRLLTDVLWLSAGVRQRRWPLLENQEPGGS